MSLAHFILYKPGQHTFNMYITGNITMRSATKEKGEQVYVTQVSKGIRTRGKKKKKSPQGKRRRRIIHRNGIFILRSRSSRLRDSVCVSSLVCGSLLFFFFFSKRGHLYLTIYQVHQPHIAFKNNNIDKSSQTVCISIVSRLSIISQVGRLGLMMMMMHRIYLRCCS